MIEAIELQQQDNTHHENNRNTRGFEKCEGIRIFFLLSQKPNLNRGREIGFVSQPSCEFFDMDVRRIILRCIRLDKVIGQEVTAFDFILTRFSNTRGDRGERQSPLWGLNPQAIQFCRCAGRGGIANANVDFLIRIQRTILPDESAFSYKL